MPAISKSDIEAVLSRIRSLSAQNHSLDTAQVHQASTAGFSDIMTHIKEGLNSVSKAEHESETFKQAYIKGDSDVPLSQVLVSSARSKVAFEGLIAVRKLFVEAYKEVMNMPV